MRIVLAALAATLFLTAAAAAQTHKFAPKQEPTQEQKLKAIEKQARDRDTEERYRASIKQIPEQKPADPWGGMRGQSGTK